MSSTTEELALRARFLRNAAPQPFMDFLVAFTAYTDRRYRDLVDTDAVFLQQVQGHAQQCKVILQVLDGVKNG